MVKDKILCIPKSSIRKIPVKKAHEGHFGLQKTSDIFHEHFYWPHMKHDEHTFYDISVLFARKLNLSVFVYSITYFKTSLD